MTHYIELFNPLAFAFLPFYCLVLLGALTVLADRTLDSKKDKLFFGFLFCFFCVVVFYHVNIRCHSSLSDTIPFAQLVEDGFHDSSSLGVKLYVLISFPLRHLAAQELELYLIIQCCVFFLSILVLWRGWQLHCRCNRIETGSFQLLIMLSVLYPAAFTFITIPLREFIQVFGFCLFLYGLMQFRYEGKLFG